MKKKFVFIFCLVLLVLVFSVYAQECQSDSDCKSIESNRHCDDRGQACFTLTEYKCENPGTDTSKCVVARAGSGCSTCSYGCENGYCKTQVVCPQIAPFFKKEGCDYFLRYDSNNCLTGYDEKCTALPAGNQTTTPIIQCTDSDNGRNYEVKGTTKDYHGEKIDYCQTDKDLTEYYCDRGWGAFEQITYSISNVFCQYGCKDGACLQKPIPVCGNGICDDESETTNCLQDCKALIKCSSDSDCSQSTTTKSCGPKIMPRDPSGKPRFDSSYACKSEGKCACQNPGTYNSVCQCSLGESCNPCQNGCKDGECIGGTPIPSQICTDSDGGINYYVSGCVEMLNDPSFGIGGKKCDFCMGANKYLQEYVCENGIYRGDHTYQCPDGCLNGACTKGESIKEQVKCIFENSNSEQRCYGSGDKYSCPGKDSCVIDIIGNKGEQLVWKSSCGGYAYTTIDGNNEEARFNCQITPVPVNETVILPNGFKNAYIRCQDGKETKQGDETSCKPAEVWKNYAQEACKYNCQVYDKEHKKCSLNIHKAGNPVAKLSVKGKEYIIEFVSSSDSSITLKISGSESIVKEFAEGTREKVFDLTIVVNSAQPGEADIVVEGEDTVSCMKCGASSFSVYNECSLENIVKPSVCGNGICESGEWQICKLTATACKEGETCKASTADCYIPCPQDCPKGKEGIYAKLNEKFKLQMSQEAKFTDYQNLVIKFNDLFVPKCNPTSRIQESATETTQTPIQTQPTETKISTVEKYPITGKAINPFLAEWTKPSPTPNPEKCIEGGEPYAVLQFKTYGTEEKTEVIKIQLGERKKVFDATISFLDYDQESKSGVFLVSLDKEFACPENCVCDIYGQVKECRRIEKCPENKMLCQDGTCREKCEITNITPECKFGCFYQDKCLPYGLRVNGLYCSINNDLKAQLNAEEKCENSFECSSNLCLNSKCVNSNLIQKFIEWLKSLFS